MASAPPDQSSSDRKQALLTACFKLTKYFTIHSMVLLHRTVWNDEREEHNRFVDLVPRGLVNGPHLSGNHAELYADMLSPAEMAAAQWLYWQWNDGCKLLPAVHMHYDAEDGSALVVAQELMYTWTVIHELDDQRAVEFQKVLMKALVKEIDRIDDVQPLAAYIPAEGEYGWKELTRYAPVAATTDSNRQMLTLPRMLFAFKAAILHHEGKETEANELAALLDTDMIEAADEKLFGNSSML